MAVTIYEVVPDSLETLPDVAGDYPVDLSPYLVNAEPDTRWYTQKCIDSITGLWTYWKTPYIDINGNEYPGAGFDATYYKIVGIVSSRDQ